MGHSETDDDAENREHGPNLNDAADGPNVLVNDLCVYYSSREGIDDDALVYNVSFDYDDHEYAAADNARLNCWNDDALDRVVDYAFLALWILAIVILVFFFWDVENGERKYTLRSLM